MIINACYVTNTGKVRRNNEDSLLLNETVVTGNMSGVQAAGCEGDRQAYMVADGMGGHAKGEVASSTVLTVFRERYGDIDTPERVREIVRLAKERLNRLAAGDANSFGLGTTVAGLFFSRAMAFLLNCGDSRVYEAGDRLRKITKDHSLVQELVDEGTISEEEMRTHPAKNIITSALVGDSVTSLPLFSLEEIEIRKGQRFLLCSDGLWESLGNSYMEECLRDREIREGSECLFRQSLAAGAADNVSFILLEVTEA